MGKFICLLITDVPEKLDSGSGDLIRLPYMKDNVLISTESIEHLTWQYYFEN
jgi:hypothetical protein